MFKLSDLLEQNRTNYYNMLVIVGENRHPTALIDVLKEKGWTPYDVNHAVLRLMGKVPPDKIQKRIAKVIKDWVISIPEKAIFYNGNILYSPDFGRLNPVGAFKYRSRNKEMVVVINGHLAGNKIRYSEIGREDFNEMDVSELICARMEDIDVES